MSSPLLMNILQDLPCFHDERITMNVYSLNEAVAQKFISDESADLINNLNWYWLVLAIKIGK